MLKVILFFCVLTVICISCQQPVSTEKQLDILFDSIFKKDEPGGAVLIATDNQIIYQKGFGLADIVTKEPITPNTLFNTGSISKTFVAFGILKLAKENKLSLDDDLYKYFPDFKDSSIAKKVKLYHLLTHTSGLPDLRKISADSAFYLTAKDPENWAPIKQTDSLEFEPGEQYHYSNPAFNGLALIIEKVSGVKWQEYIISNIMKPAGMETSTITDGPHPEKGVSHGYWFDGQKYFEKDYGEEPTFAASGNGGIWSSVSELWKYEQAIQNNIFLDSSWVKKSRTVFEHKNWKGSNPSDLGMSWFITNYWNHEMIGHTGSQGGFRADYVWIPEHKIFYAILCNTPKQLGDVRNSVSKILNF